jgi:hypothetical protein
LIFNNQVLCLYITALSGGPDPPVAWARRHSLGLPCLPEPAATKVAYLGNTVPRYSAAAAVVALGLFWPAGADVPAGPLLGVAAPSAEVQSGYQLLWSGDEASAQRYFGDLSKQRPDDLAALFGLMMAEYERIDADEALVPVFERSLDTFVDRADKRVTRDPRDGEALYYRAFGRSLRGVYKFENDKGTLGAARDAAKAKGDMETYLKAHPDDADGSLVVGFYNYFVSLAPAYMHIVRFFLFLPAADHNAGLEQIERAASGGRLFAPEARKLLIGIYASDENRPADALALGQRLQQQYPNNDDVAFAIADLYQSPSIEDREKAEGVYSRIVSRRERDTSIDGLAARYRAVLELAGVRFDEWKCAEALATLTPTIDAHPSLPSWVLPQFLLRRASDRLLMNDAGGSEDAHRVQNDAAMAKWRKDATDLLAKMARRSPADARMAAALIPANRLVAERKWDAARAAYAPFAKATPRDPQIRYRLAIIDFESGSADRARPVFSVLANAKASPDWVRAWSFVYEGRTDDLAGRREVARKEYQTVVDNFSKLRAADAARAGLVAPYRRPAAAGAGS